LKRTQVPVRKGTHLQIFFMQPIKAHEKEAQREKNITMKKKPTLITVPKYIATLLFAAVFASGYAQTTLYNDGGTLHVEEGALLYVEGDVMNMDTAIIQNDGVVELMGELHNDNTAQMKNGNSLSSTERAYKFIGTGTQAITGNLSNTSTRYIHNLIVDKAYSNTAVQLQTNTYVTGSLVFGSSTTGADTYTPTDNSTLTDNMGQGIIQTYNGSTDYELFITNSSANAVVGYAPLTINGNPTDAYIQTRGAQGVGDGGFSRNVSSLGAAYVFPVGSSTNGYNAAALTFTALGTTPDKIRNMFVDATGGVGQLRKTCTGCNGLSPDNDGFNYYFSSNTCNGSTPKWVILDALPTDHGYWSFNGNSGDQYFIETYPNSFPGFSGTDADDWRMIKKSGDITAVPTGDWTPEILTSIQSPTNLLTYNRNGGCYTGDGVPGGIFEGFSHFQMARSQTGSTLPVEMLYLTAQGVDNKFIRLNWATAVEINNSGFKVMRSSNGSHFEQIGWVDNKTGGNSTSETTYSFDDNTAQPNITYYYKLNQVDFDGASKDSKIVEASLQGADVVASEFFPNPANESTQIIISTPVAEKYTVELYNMTGQLIMQNEIITGAGSSRFSFSTSTLAQGSYRAAFKSGNQTFTRNLNIIK